MSAAEKASEGWGVLPDWIARLVEAVDRSSQNAIAAELGVSVAYVSWAIRNHSPEYHGRVEDAVRSRLMAERIECPVVGEIAPDICRAHRSATRRANGPVQRRLRAACPSCPNNPQGESSHE